MTLFVRGLAGMVLLLFVNAATLSATTLAGVSFSDHYDIQGHHLKLKGLGLKRFFIFKIFVVGFYEEETAPDPLADAAKRLEVAYFQNIPAARLAKETRRKMMLNTTKEAFDKISKRVDVMDPYFVNIKTGDRYVLTYIPGTGTTFTYNGKDVGVIEGADFARALFAVWFGKFPVDENLKTRLSGAR